MLDRTKGDIKELALTKYELYFENAKEQLKKAEKNGDFYGKVKYVRSSCGTLYLGLLLIVEAIIEIKNNKNLPQKYDINVYRKELGKHNKKWLENLNKAYDLLHLKGYYTVKNNPFTPKDWSISLEYIDYFTKELQKL